MSGDWPSLAHLFATDGDQPGFPGVHLGTAAAVIIVTRPETTRPIARVGHWAIGLGTLGALLAPLATPSGTLAALFIATGAAATVRLVFGTSSGRPSPQEITDGLAGLGVRADSLTPSARQSAGVFEVRAIDDRARDLVVRVYGRDAYDNQRLARMWRAIFYHDRGPTVGANRAQAAEHEALLTLLASSAGVPTWPIVAVGATGEDDGLVVLASGPGERPLAEVTGDQLDDAALVDAFHSLESLHVANSAHRQLDPTTILVDGDGVKLVDWTNASVGASLDQRQADRAQLLASLASAAGAERAIGAALEAIGTEDAKALLPYLQEAAFDSRLRAALKDAGIDGDALRKQTAEKIGVEPPELAELRRVTWSSVLQTGLLVLAAYALISGLGDLDFGTVADEVRGASWGWLAFALVLAQAPRLCQALSTLGTVAARLPYWPVYMMQLATGFMNLALPSSLAQMSINVRFFQRFGIPSAAAVTAGVIDSLAGNVVQALLLVALLLFSQTTLDLDYDAAAEGVGQLLAALGIALVVGVIALALVPPLRHWFLGRISGWWPDVRDALRALRAGRKTAYLLGGALGAEILFAAALGAFARAFGYDLALSDLLLVNISVSLLASFIPVPGGIGVTEGGLIVGLTSIGVTEEVAAAVAILYRVATFYLPPIWGYFALDWLRRNRYL